MKKNKKLAATFTFVVVIAMLLTGSALAATGEATVNSYMLNMREGPGTGYLITDVAYAGNTVTVLQDDGSGWVLVSFNGHTGYMNKLYLTFTGETSTQTYTAPVQAETAQTAPAAAPAPEAPAAQTQSVQVQAAQANTVTAAPAAPAPTGGSGSGSILGSGVYLRSGPSLTSSVLAVLDKGASLQVNGACGAWYEVVYNGSVGYIYGDYVVMSGQTVTYTVSTATAAADAPVYSEPATPEINAVTPSQETPVQSIPVTQEPAAQQPVQQTQPASSSGSASGQAIVNTAMQYVGTPYKWAGNSPETGFDCSGFVQYVYGENGYKLNRVAQSMYYNGEAVDLEDLQPGDVLLFGSSVYNIWHTGIYVGDGEFIHSPASGYSVGTQSLDETYGMRLVAARRIVE